MVFPFDGGGPGGQCAADIRVHPQPHTKKQHTLTHPFPDVKHLWLLAASMKIRSHISKHDASPHCIGINSASVCVLHELSKGDLWK